MSNPKHIVSLDGWRAIAVLMVIWAHWGAMGLSESDYFGKTAYPSGSSGVSIFFGLSGFLITTLLIQEKQRNNAIHMTGFYLRRAFRILPPLFLLLGVIGLAGLYHSGLEVWSCLLFFRNYVTQAVASGFTLHIWSLSVEEHFYLFWPALLVLLFRLTANSLARVSWAMWILVLGCTFWEMVEGKYHLVYRYAPFLDGPFRTDLRLDGILAGAAAAVTLAHPGYREKVRNLLHPAIYLALFIYAILIIFTKRTPYGGFALCYVIALLLAGTALHPEWIFSRLLETPPLRWIGKLSYSLYLWQQIFLVTGWEKERLPWGLDWLQTPYWGLAATLGMAALSYWTLEKWCVAFARRRFSA